MEHIQWKIKKRRKNMLQFFFLYNHFDYKISSNVIIIQLYL